MLTGRVRMTFGAIAVSAVVTLVAAGAARADDVTQAKNDAGMGAATVVANLFYMPVKIGYAMLGGLTGGLGYAVTGGNREVAERVWVSSFGGDYVLTRRMVQGQERIQFSGTTDPDM